MDEGPQTRPARSRSALGKYGARASLAGEWATRAMLALLAAFLLLASPLGVAQAPIAIDRVASATAPALENAAGIAALPAVATEQDIPRPLQVAPGVYAMLGNGDAVAPRNHGIVANSGFLVGTSGVVVIDTGSSYRFGRAMIEAIHRVTPLPIELVILTHQAPEFVFGASAFRDAGVPILAHRRTAELIRERCSICLANLRRTLGEDEMSGSRVTVPDRTIDGTTRIEAGGRAIELLNFGVAATPGDLAVRDERTGVLFAGALVSIGRIPELRNESIPGWIAALDRLGALEVTKVVPGFGPVVGPERIGATGEYLRELDASVRREYASGRGLVSARERAETPHFRTWKLYSTVHPQNVQRVYLELEHQ
ncbi:MBL fold metallo-hydrolase [Trinickia symbiotica]|uniref:MBL fold metallo-hydrolase n=2 Tax=Trinickia symbiotica TaxID=863227 RepID=A0A2T3XLY2_9BURK|nr:MBL fold metallo-hydrolase [Trinickia symbiotica]